MSVWPNFRSPLLVGRLRGEHLRHGFGPLLVSGDDPGPGDAPRSGDHAAAAGSVWIFALGWRGSARQWHVYERAYLLLAALATPLVLSVHSVVSFDFAVSVVPGWHTTIFPPYFVAGRSSAGSPWSSPMVPARAFFGLKELVTVRHLENMNKIILAHGLIVGYAYSTESSSLGMAETTQMVRLHQSGLGADGWAYWIMFTCNVLFRSFSGSAWRTRCGG